MHTQTILVVDDDSIILNYLSRFLHLEGFEVITCSDGTEAIELLTLNKPDLILLDVSMPNMDGFEVCMKVRKISNVPLIFLSAKNEVHHRIMGFSCGCDDYIAKPFDSTELLLRIKALLRRTKGICYLGMDSVKSAYGITINRTTHLVTKNHRQIELTAKEFELLWLLMSHPQQVFTRDQLVYHISNSDYCGDTAAINMLVKRLRVKIEDNPSQPKYIKTIRGVGYKFEH